MLDAVHTHNAKDGQALSNVGSITDLLNILKEMEVRSQYMQWPGLLTNCLPCVYRKRSKHLAHAVRKISVSC